MRLDHSPGDEEHVVAHHRQDQAGHVEALRRPRPNAPTTNRLCPAASSSPITLYSYTVLTLIVTVTRENTANRPSFFIRNFERKNYCYDSLLSRHQRQFMLICKTFVSQNVTVPSMQKIDFVMCERAIKYPSF